MVPGALALIAQMSSKSEYQWRWFGLMSYFEVVCSRILE